MSFAAVVATAQDQGPTAKPFSVALRRFSFNPSRIEVNQDDLVKIELRTEDIAHSLTIDAYRIAKRVGPGHRHLRVPRRTRRDVATTQPPDRDGPAYHCDS